MIKRPLTNHQRRKTSVYDKRLESCLSKDPSLDKEQAKVILQSFSRIDENGDGKISKRELARAYRLAGFNPTHQEIEDIIGEHDTNNDGYIDFEEYFAVMKNRVFNLDLEKERMKTAFRVLDRDKDGYITVQELEEAFSRTKEAFTAQEIADIMRAADTNKDGKIDYNEFVDAQLCQQLF